MRQMKRKLTSRQKWLRENYTERDKYSNVWLVVDHQSFQFQTIDPDMEQKEAKQYANWRCDQIAVALDRLIEQVNSPTKMG